MRIHHNVLVRLSSWIFNEREKSSARWRCTFIIFVTILHSDSYTKLLFKVQWHGNIKFYFKIQAHGKFDFLYIKIIIYKFWLESANKEYYINGLSNVESRQTWGNGTTVNNIQIHANLKRCPSLLLLDYTTTIWRKVRLIYQFLFEIKNGNFVK